MSATKKGLNTLSLHMIQLPNTVFEEMKTKAKAALECEDKAANHARRKVEVESVFGNIKGNRSFRRHSLRGLDKVNIEFEIVALAHNQLKVAGIRLATFLDPIRTKKKLVKKEIFFASFFTILGLFRQPPFTLLYICSTIYSPHHVR